MRRILVVSPEDSTLESFKRALEGERFLVLLAASLEEAFLEFTRQEPSLVVVDGCAIPEELWGARKLVRWFRRRSPVWLLSGDRCSGLEDECDRILKREVEKNDLAALLRELRGTPSRG